MAKYLISFPSAAMVVPDGELEAVGADARAVVEEAKAAGVYVFAGGIDESVPPVRVSGDGAVAAGGYPWAPSLDGGFTVLELPSREDAIAWAARALLVGPAVAARSCACSLSIRSPEPPCLRPLRRRHGPSHGVAGLDRPFPKKKRACRHSRCSPVRSCRPPWRHSTHASARAARW